MRERFSCQLSVFSCQFLGRRWLPEGTPLQFLVVGRQNGTEQGAQAEIPVPRDRARGKASQGGGGISPQRHRGRRERNIFCDAALALLEKEAGLSTAHRPFGLSLRTSRNPCATKTAATLRLLLAWIRCGGRGLAIRELDGGPMLEPRLCCAARLLLL